MERRGKGSPLVRQRRRLCKPHPEQDRKETADIFVPRGCSSRFRYRSLETAGNGSTRQMIIHDRTRLTDLLDIFDLNINISTSVFMRRCLFLFYVLCFMFICPSCRDVPRPVTRVCALAPLWKFPFGQARCERGG